MPFTNFPNGLTSFGIPLFGGVNVAIPNLNGTCFFVDAINGSDGNDGSTPQSAFKTIGRAVSIAASGTGTTIFIFPGTYNENVVVSKNNLAFIAAYPFTAGMGGNTKPLINPTTGIALTLNQATGLYFYGLKFATTAATTTAVTTDSTGTVFDSCHFSATGAGVTFTSAVSASFKGDGTVFSNCWFNGNTNGIKCTNFASPGTGNAANCLVNHCYFNNNSAADIADDGAAAVFWSGWVIKNSNFYTKAKAVYLAMSGNGSQTTTFCTITGNFFGATAAMTSTMIALEAGSTFIGNTSTIGVVDGHTF